MKKRRWRWVTITGGATLVLVLVLLALAGLVVSGHIVSPPRRALQDYHREILANPSDRGLAIRSYTGPEETPCLLVEPIAVPGMAKRGRKIRDLLQNEGVKLPPWGQTRGTIILLHGHKGRKEDSLTIAERFCAIGFRCVLPDLPGHGESPHPVACFGCGECELMEELRADLPRRFGFDPEPVGLFGFSQGGAIALQTAARPGKPWLAVVSVSSFSSLADVVGVSARTHAGNFGPVLAGACDLGIWCGAGFLPSESSPLKAARKLEIPVFIGHGAADTAIPPAQGKEIYDAIPGHRKTFRLVPEGTHNDVFLKGGDGFYEEICRFYLEGLKG